MNALDEPTRLSWLPRVTLVAAALVAAAIFAVALAPPGHAQQSTELAGRQTDSGSAAYFEVESVNSSLTPLEDVNLETPQSCVEHFILAGRNEDWRRAAAALNFRLLGEVGEQDAERIAEQFFFVLNQELWINWDLLPDRPDGLLEGSAVGANAPMTGQVRRAINLGTIDLDRRSVPIQIHRVKAESGAPVWLFSAHSVDNVDALWEVHGPSWIARQMPAWARERGPLRIHVWQWIGLGLSLIVAPVMGFVIGARLIHWVTAQVPGRTGKFASALKWPLAAVFASALVWASLKWILGMPSAVAAVLEPLSLIVLVAMVVWLAMRASAYVIDRVVKEEVKDAENLQSVSRRRLLTQITVARHVLLLVLALLGVAVVLLQLDSFRTLGISLLSSAGAAAVILGIAGHAVLGNLIAGLQIAFVQPFRIGDTVYIENNWGYIEEITYVYVIVRTWDERRVVFPIRYFISNWFENWSKTDVFLVKPIYLQVDYRADVEAIRSKFLELIKADENWASDRDEPEALVTACDEETMTVRLTCGAENPSKAWYLVCRIREQIIAWLQQEQGGAYLPRRRLALDDRDRSGAPAGGEREDPIAGPQRAAGGSRAGLRV